jgi:hypothetical protein
MQSGADDVMILETTKKRYKNQTGGSEFKRFYWWEVVKNQPSREQSRLAPRQLIHGCPRVTVWVRRR